MIRLVRVLGLWLLERFGMPIVRDLRAGNRRAAGRRVRRLATAAIAVGAAVLVLGLLLAVVVIVLLRRLLG